MLKRKRITMEQAHQALDIYKTIPIRFVEVELAEALEISDELGIYAYDAYLLRCALRYKMPLLTLDKDLLVYAAQKGVRTLEVIP